MTDSPSLIIDLPLALRCEHYRQELSEELEGFSLTDACYMAADQLEARAKPRVKPLVWDDRRTTGVMFQYRVHIGYGLMDGVFALTLSGATIGEFPSEDAAKAAAQSDYERRILEALE